MTHKKLTQGDTVWAYGTDWVFIEWVETRKGFRKIALVKSPRITNEREQGNGYRHILEGFMYDSKDCSSLVQFVS